MTFRGQRTDTGKVGAGAVDGQTAKKGKGKGKKEIIGEKKEEQSINDKGTEEGSYRGVDGKGTSMMKKEEIGNKTRRLEILAGKGRA